MFVSKRKLVTAGILYSLVLAVSVGVAIYTTRVRGIATEEVKRLRVENRAMGDTIRDRCPCPLLADGVIEDPDARKRSIKIETTIELMDKDVQDIKRDLRAINRRLELAVPRPPEPFPPDGVIPDPQKRGDQ